MESSSLNQPAVRRDKVRRKRAPNWTVRLLWVMYLLSGAALLSLPGDLGAGVDQALSAQYRVLNFLIYLPLIALLVQALATSEGRSPDQPQSSLRRLVYAFLAVIVLMVLVGLLSTTSPSQYIRTAALEALPFVAVVLLLRGRDLVVAARALGMLVSVQACLGALLVLWALYRYPILNWRGEITVAHEMVFGLVAPATLAVLLLPSLVPWQRVVSVVGYAASIALGFAYQGRLTTLLQVGLLPAGWIFVQARRGALGTAVLRSAIPIALVACAATVSAITIPAIGLQIERGLEGTMARFRTGRPLIDRGDSSETPESRWIEAQEFVRTASIKTWLIGEGIGGTWRSEYMAGDFPGYRWPMVHFGPLHLILKGGLPLLILFHVVYALAIIRLWRASKQSQIAGAVLVYAVFSYLGFLSHGPLVHRYGTYFTWAVLGTAFAALPASHGSSSRLPSR